MAEKMAARCHCGALAFDVTLTDGFNSVRRCNCSLCRMRGAVVVFAEKPEIVRGAETLTEYRFNSQSVAHYFCSRCGIYPFHQSRSNPQQYAVNVACIEGVSPFDFSPLNVSNGDSHPKDGGSGGIAGVLTYRSTGN